jgi:hypothetical protein
MKAAANPTSIYSITKMVLMDVSLGKLHLVLQLFNACLGVMGLFIKKIKTDYFKVSKSKKPICQSSFSSFNGKSKEDLSLPLRNSYQNL